MVGVICAAWQKEVYTSLFCWGVWCSEVQLAWLWPQVTQPGNGNYYQSGDCVRKNAPESQYLLTWINLKIFYVETQFKMMRC
jgi:hypothetical protein